ncbi:MAG: DUF4399 domain-containing protein [Chitinophagaceae bacterium]
MKRQFVLPIVCALVIIACNNSSDQSAKTADTTAAAKTDTMAGMKHDTMNHTVDASKPAPPLPDVPAGAKVMFKGLKNGATVSSPLKVQMGAEGIKVDTAGPVIAGVGHHHLFIDAEDSLTAGTMVPKDSTHLHFGKAQTETEVKLTPGKHKLTLQFADGLHRSYGSKLATTITVDVKK